MLVTHHNFLMRQALLLLACSQDCGPDDYKRLQVSHRGLPSPHLSSHCRSLCLLQLGPCRWCSGAWSEAPLCGNPAELIGLTLSRTTHLLEVLGACTLHEGGGAVAG